MEATSLVVFDFDGTLSRGPTICEVLAESLSKLPRMKEIELLKTKDELTAAREEMAPWWDSMSEEDITKSLQGVKLAPRREEAFSLLREHGVVIAIASITCRFAIEHFAKEWEIEHYIGTGTSEAGVIEHVWAEQKAEFLKSLSTELGLPRSRIAAIGDSSGDFDMLDVAGEPIFVGASTAQCAGSWKHMPNADISEIAEYLVEKWQLRSHQNLQRESAV